MEVRIIKGDLFTADKSCILAHCISADFALGAGIAKIFRDKLGTKKELEAKYSGEWKGKGYSAFTLSYETGKNWLVVNLITKERSFHKPTYEALQQSLEDMLGCLQYVLYKSPDLSGVKIAMPLIGCGLDGLSWEKVRRIIGEVFGKTNVTIFVYVLEDREYERVLAIEDGIIRTEKEQENEV